MLNLHYSYRMRSIKCNYYHKIIIRKIINQHSTEWLHLKWISDQPANNTATCFRFWCFNNSCQTNYNRTPHIWGLSSTFSSRTKLISTIRAVPIAFRGTLQIQTNCKKPQGTEREREKSQIDIDHKLDTWNYISQ